MTVFIDTNFFLALINSTDRYHRRARRLAEERLRHAVTTEAVLVEVGNSLSRLRYRKLAAKLIERLLRKPQVIVVTTTEELFKGALKLYASRQDKEWGMTDCISFVVMEQRGLHEALTADRHFTEAGFHALMA